MGKYQVRAKRDCVYPNYVRKQGSVFIFTGEDVPDFLEVVSVISGGEASKTTTVSSTAKTTATNATATNATKTVTK